MEIHEEELESKIDELPFQSKFYEEYRYHNFFYFSYEAQIQFPKNRRDIVLVDRIAKNTGTGEKDYATYLICKVKGELVGRLLRSENLVKEIPYHRITEEGKDILIRFCEDRKIANSQEYETWYKDIRYSKDMLGLKDKINGEE